MRFNPNQSERVRVRGVVLANFPGGSLFVRGEGGAIEVEALSSEVLTVGQKLDMVGFPRPGEIHPILRDTLFRIESSSTSPTPIKLSFDEVAGNDLHGDLVQVEARVADHFHRPSDSTIVLETTAGRFYAKVPHGGVRLEKSSWISLTGICLLQPNIGKANMGPSSDQKDLSSSGYTMKLLVRSDADVVVLQGPLWWTIQRIGMIAAAFAVAAAATMIWSFLLRHKVKEQTQIIVAKIENEKVMEERARIARELHDTLEQELIGVTMQLDNASSRLGTAPERARESIDLARAMLRHSRAETRRSVWDLRASLVTRNDLTVTLHEIKNQLEILGGPKFHVHVHAKIPTLPGRMANHFLRVAREAMVNALKHADPSTVSVNLSVTNEKKELRLCVIDDGNGFDPEECPNATDGHFGLSGMQERAGKLCGVLCLRSSHSEGTTVTLTAALPTDGGVALSRSKHLEEKET